MNDITIKITGKQYIGDETEEKVEFVTDGKVSEKNGAMYYIYDESQFSGMPGCKTMLKYKDGCLKMKRLGQGTGYDTELVFDRGSRFTSQYNTPFGVLDMEVLTNSVNADIDDDGRGHIEIDYHIVLSNVSEGRNFINIDIS